MNALIWILIIILLFLLVIIMFIFSWLSWNIPITVLRFMGNKQRPLMIHKKGRKRMIKGVPFLQVRGYKAAIRDFKSSFYWPALKGKWGGLILWEFEDGWLTPTIPKKKVIAKDQEFLIERGLEALRGVQSVKFEYDAALHHELLLKVVDDVDVEFLVEQLAREDKQYSSGLWAFLDKYGTHIVWIFMTICALVGFIIYLDKAPNLGSQCLQQLGEVVKDDFLQKAANSVVPKG